MSGCEPQAAVWSAACQQFNMAKIKYTKMGNLISEKATKKNYI